MHPTNRALSHTPDSNFINAVTNKEMISSEASRTLTADMVIASRMSPARL